MSFNFFTLVSIWSITVFRLSCWLTLMCVCCCCCCNIPYSHNSQSHCMCLAADEKTYSMVVHTTVPFGLENINCNVDSVCCNVVLSRLRQLLPQLPTSLTVQPYRWQYSQVFYSHCLYYCDPTLWFCYCYCLIIIIISILLFIFVISSLFSLLQVCKHCHTAWLWSEICCWNFNAVCRISRDISISGVVATLIFPVFFTVAFIWGYFVWAWCRQILLFNTYFELKRVSHSLSQHEHKISPGLESFVWRHA